MREAPLKKGKVWYLKKLSIFKSLGEKRIRRLARFLLEKEVQRRVIVFEPEDEDKVFFVKRGAVEVYQLTADGKKIILDTLTPGSFFSAVGPGLKQQNFLEALEDTFLCVTTKARLFEMLAAEPVMAKELIEGLFEQLFEAREQIAVLASGSVQDRLVYLLKLLSRKYGVKQAGGVKILRRFTHEDMANMVGSSRETVTKLLGRLERGKYIRRQGRVMLVLDRLLEKDG